MRQASSSAQMQEDIFLPLSSPAASRLPRLFSGGGRRWRRIEINLRRCLDLPLVLDRKIWLLLIAKHHRRQITREGSNCSVVVLHGLDVAIARRCDPVLGGSELGH